MTCSKLDYIYVGNNFPGGGVGVLWTSSEGDDPRIFGGFEIFYSGIFLACLAGGISLAGA